MKINYIVKGSVEVTDWSEVYKAIKVLQSAGFIVKSLEAIKEESTSDLPY